MQGFYKNPNYNQIGTGRTGHAESVEVIYNPNQVSYGTLLRVFLVLMIQQLLIDKDQIMDLNIVR